MTFLTAGIDLTLAQEEVIKEILYELRFSDDPVRAVLCGYAGTGKTVTTAALISRVAEGERVVVATPTHKARVQVEKALTENGASNFESVTIARLLGLRQYDNMDTGDQDFVPDPSSKNMLQKCEVWSEAHQCKVRVKPIDIVIVDEVSMLHSELYDMLLKYLRDRPIIFVGDDRQLLPVTENEVCPAFTKATSTHRLTEVIRHDGAILNLATATRKLTDGRARYVAAEGGGTKVVTYKSKREWLNAFIETSLQPEAKDDVDFCRALAYTNMVVDDLNDRVHQGRYGDHAAMFREGMACVTVDAIPNPDKGPPLINSSVDVIVEEVSFCNAIYEYPPEIKNGLSKIYEKNNEAPPDEESYIWKIWDLTVKTSGQAGIKFRSIDKSDQKAWKRYLETIKIKALNATSEADRKMIFRSRFNRLESVGFIQPNSALTIHKSQGSTYKNVFLHWDIDNPKFAKTQNQLAYVGITRASETLHVLAD